MKNLWERKKGVLTILVLPPLLIYLASTTSSEYGWMVAILYILAGVIVIFILTGGLSTLMTDKEYKEHEKNINKSEAQAGIPEEARREPRVQAKPSCHIPRVAPLPKKKSKRKQENEGKKAKKKVDG